MWVSSPNSACRCPPSHIKQRISLSAADLTSCVRLALLSSRFRLFWLSNDFPPINDLIAETQQDLEVEKMEGTLLDG